MINILLEGCDIHAPWLFDALKRYLKPSHRVCVIALSFRDAAVKGLDDWNALYARERGCYYTGIVESLSAYGIGEEQIEFINLSRTTAAFPLLTISIWKCTIRDRRNKTRPSSGCSGRSASLCMPRILWKAAFLWTGEASN